MPRKKQKTLHALKAKAWKLLSECVRREAADGNGMVRCYTCGEVHHWKEIQAGHAIGGRNGAVLLDEELIRPQNVRCNIMLRGNYPEFITRLITEKSRTLGVSDGGYHLDAFRWWESKLASAKQIKKWTRQELLDKCEEYKARLSRLDH